MGAKATPPQPSRDRNKLPPIELYTPQRRAEFLLSNSIDEEDYRRARKLVEAMGLSPGCDSSLPTRGMTIDVPGFPRRQCVVVGVLRHHQPHRAVVGCSAGRTTILNLRNSKRCGTSGTRTNCGNCSDCFSSCALWPHPVSEMPPDIELDPKDQPILLAAIDGRATHLITGDGDFGALFGRTIRGVTIVRPRDFIAAVAST